ncbi:hypothetical protein P280DRAFT_519213 [Massarina eburnea CBS 473.64]|uniref:Leo1-domain-containing protein n=1 Tax=Massarina eburnea CBS 473.64 TaxID=1395130 RepID=A0A6A6S0T5_9PLEO|nr:hypothetical protein P280DRAFT_519213 [Massarina eburnea CBS 473.64]
MADDALGISSDDEAFTGSAAPLENEEPDAGGDAGPDEDEDDLFGDGGDEPDEEPESRKLDDEDLDSGDDDGRADRAAVTPAYQQEQVEYNFMDADVARHAIPEPSDGELYLLKIPPFLTIEPSAFDHKTFQPPTTDHHSKVGPSDHFSAFNTATTTIRWRRSPSDRTKLQSNARILRWSDGSLTLQFANDPLNQYEINPQMLAPPQVKPRIPVPMHASKNRDTKESYTYLSAIYQDSGVLRVTNKLTTALSVVPALNTKDAALEKLQNDLAKAATRGRDSADQAISFIDVNEDPELRRQREEASHKEKMKQQRAREKVREREMERNSRASRGTGYRSHAGGLDLGGLEGEEGGRRGGPKKPRKAARHQDWSDDDEPYRGRGNKEDEYDEDDDFIAASDEEEVVEEEEDDDDGITEAPKARRRESPKRDRGGDYDDDDEDVQVRSKKRRVIEDDEDEEE